MIFTIYLPLILISLFNLIYFVSKKPHNIGLHILNFIYFFIYGLAGCYSIFQYNEQIDLYVNLNRQDYYIVFSCILVTLSYFISLYFYKFFQKIGFLKLNLKLNFNSIKVASIISFFLCSIFILVYISQYGGFTKALAATSAIRAGFGELEEGASGATFVKYLMPIGVFPLLYSTFMLLDTNRKKYILFFIISFLQVFIAFLLMGGRTRIVIYLTSIIIIYLYMKGRSIRFYHIVKFSPIFLLVSFFIVFGKQFFSSFDAIIKGESIKETLLEKESSSFFESSVGYFCHRTYSIEMALIEFDKSNFIYWFKDNFLSLLYFIPERITGIVKPNSISLYNTEMLTGINSSMIPPGIIGYGVYSLWFPGAFIAAIIYSFIFSFMDRIYLSNLDRKYSLIIVLPILIVWGLYGSTGDFKIIVNSISYILIFLIIMFIYSRIKG